MLTARIYLDNNATTRVAPGVLEAMLPFFTEFWGNPSSAYWFGHQLGEVMDTARDRVARLIGAERREILFTSCGTESNNAAIHSALQARPARRHVITSAVEHSATLKYCASLETQGYEVTCLGVNGDGLLSVEQVAEALRPDTALVSIMLANNETGILFPVRSIAALCRQRGVLCHTDAVQAAGKIPLDVADLGVDMLSLSGHKLHAPKGIGALFIRQGLRFHPFMLGGAQERGRRGGTENVPYIVGFGRAAELAAANLAERGARMTALRDQLEEGLRTRVPAAQRNGASSPRLPNTLNIAFDGVEAEGMLLLLDQAGICASSGSACTTGSLEPSHVLTAMGCSPARARGSLRFSLGEDTQLADIQSVLDVLPGIVAKLRALTPPG